MFYFMPADNAWWLCVSKWNDRFCWKIDCYSLCICLDLYL